MRVSVRWLAGVLAVLVVAAAAVVVAVGGASAAPTSPTNLRGLRYLALGDSVSFGYRPMSVTPSSVYENPNNFLGYPEWFADFHSLYLTNLSCPGETSGSMITGTGSNGCEDSHSPQSETGYRDLYPLHVQYRGTQLGFALHYLRHHPRTRLVSLTIGANDAFECEEDNGGACTGDAFKQLAVELQTNISKVLTAIRAVYHGDLAVMTYYALNYSDAAAAAQVRGLNQIIRAAAAPFSVLFFNGYIAFRNASASSGGDACAAGLLVRLSSGCDIHPSKKGARILAAALGRAVANGDAG